MDWVGKFIFCLFVSSFLCFRCSSGFVCDVVAARTCGTRKDSRCGHPSAELQDFPSYSSPCRFEKRWSTHQTQIDFSLTIYEGGKIALNIPGLAASNGSIQGDVSNNNHLFVQCLPKSWTEQRMSSGEFEFLTAGENIADWVLERVDNDDTANAVVGPYCAAEIENRLQEVRDRSPELPEPQVCFVLVLVFDLND